MSDFCSNCGTSLHGDRFCPSCGHPNTSGGAGESPTAAVTPATPPAPPVAAAAVVAPAAPSSSMSGTTLGLIIGGGLVLVALLVVGAALMFTSRGDGGAVSVVTSQSPLPPAPTTPVAPTPTSTVTATATVTAVPPPAVPAVPVQPAFGGCPSGFSYVGQYGGFDVCRNSSISDGFAANIASAVSGPGYYSGVYSPARDKEYYFTCVSVGGGVIDCGYSPTNIANGGVVRLYP